MQHGHPVREAAQERHVVLDDDHGVILRELLEQLAGVEPLLGAHPGHRLVEQEQVGPLHQQHADLEPLLLPVAELLRRRAPRTA